MSFFQRFPISSVNRQALLLSGAALLLCLGGCGSDEPPGSSQPPPSGPSQSAAEHSPTTAAALQDHDARALHDAGIETFAIGLGGADARAVLQGISLLEQATLAAPEVSTYWVDLADAYLASGIALQYPHAIDILWMLYQEGDAQKDALLARLTEAYALVGNANAAFTVAKTRLQQAETGHADKAGLQMALLAPGNGRFAETSKALADKAAQLDGRDYLLLLASTIEEVSGNTQSAAALLDQALAKIDDPELAKYARQVRERMTP